MISTDLLSALLRGMQTPHVDRGLDTEAGALPEENAFGRFFAAESEGLPAMVAPQSFPMAIPARADGVAPEAANPDAATAEAAAQVAPDAGMPADSAQPVPDLRTAAPTGVRSASEASVATMNAAPIAEASGRNPDRPDPRATAAAPEEDGGGQRPAAAGAGVPTDRTDSTSADRPGAQPERPAGHVPLLQAIPLEAPPAAEPVAERAPAPSPPDHPAAADRAPPAVPAPANSAAAAIPAPGLAFMPAEVDPGWRLAIDPASAMPRAIPASPAPAAPVANQVTMAIRAGEGERIEIRLDPPELGRVQIEMRAVEGTLHAVIIAERPEIADILRRHAELLQRDLEAAGYASVSLEFAAGRERESSGERSAGPDEDGLPLMAAAAAPIPPARAGAPGRLDIRL